MQSRIGLLIFAVVIGCVISSGPTQASTTVMPASPEEEKPQANAAIQECRESAPSVFVPVLLTLIVVCVVMLIVFIFWKYYWRIKHGKHLVLVTDVEKGEPEYAFDNPGFREGSPASQAKKPVDVKEESRKESNSLQQQHQLSNGHKPQSGDEPTSNKSASDTKTNVIPLKSRDFTGLGFNICGNMRDGIYVKDLLHHGPASETGRIKAGDRISAIRINFSHMVYEDAMAILSYASPYDVEVEVEDSSMSPDSLKNTSLNNQIAQSFYRSQSFSTAQQIQKIVPRKLNFNAKRDDNNEPTRKAAVLEVTEMSDKMNKFGGIRVLPDIKCEKTTVVKILPLQQQAEKQPNTTVVDIECDSGIETKTPTMFDDVDLSCSSPAQHANEKPASSLTSTFKDHNMKKALVKGIQNLKEKLNNHIQKSCDKASTKECTGGAKVAKRPAAAIDEPDGASLRARSNSESDGEETARKISKRKAPMPPATSVSELSDKPSSDFNLLNEIENEVNKINSHECKDDSENEDQATNNTIELNASHITIHHVPEESNRKAASLGDLSKIADSCVAPLERAVSLELAEHTPRGSREFRVPLPSEESSDENLFKEPKPDSAVSSKLKKSSLFGTLEEAIKPNNTSDDSDSDHMLTSSTPMKLTDESLPHVESVGNISWDLSFEALDDARDEDVFLEDEKAPDLPNSPMPDGPTFVTEIKVSNDDGDDLSQVNSSDLTLFMTAAEISTNEVENHMNETSFIDGEFKLPNMSHSKAETNGAGTESEDSKDSSIDTVKEVTCNGAVNEESKTELVNETKNAGLVNSTKLKFSKENMSDEQILALNNSLTHQPTPRYRTTSNDTCSTNKKKSPNTTTKLSKLSQSISPVRAVGSRIPVRANTEPSLKVSLFSNSSNNKDDMISKTKKYKISEEPIENGKVTFTPTSHHLPSTMHKTSVLSENRHNGPNR